MIDYEKEVNNYGRSLPPLEKQVARDVFTQLLEAGKDYEWLYFGIMNLGARNIIRHRSLFFYTPFQQEVDALVAANREEEERKRQESKRICDAISKQIEEAKNQKKIVVQLAPQRKKKRPSKEEIWAMIEASEDDE